MMEVWPVNAASNTGVLPSCTYRKHSKIIQEGGGHVRTVISLQVVNTVFYKTLIYWQQVKV